MSKKKYLSNHSVVAIFFTKSDEIIFKKSFKMSQINEKIITNLEGNNKTVYINGIEILLKLLDNILNFPENEKYRKIRLDNKIIREKLLAIRGMIFVLKSIGFCEVFSKGFL